MANGHNAKYLLRAAELLETLTAQVSAASDEEKLWRYKYETLTQHSDQLEAESGRLKDDIEGHVMSPASSWRTDQLRTRWKSAKPSCWN